MGMGAEGEAPAPPPPPSNEIVDITDKINKAECFVLNQVWVAFEGGYGRVDVYFPSRHLPSSTPPIIHSFDPDATTHPTTDQINQ